MILCDDIEKNQSLSKLVFHANDYENFLSDIQRNACAIRAVNYSPSISLTHGARLFGCDLSATVSATVITTSRSELNSFLLSATGHQIQLVVVQFEFLMIVHCSASLCFVCIYDGDNDEV